MHEYQGALQLFQEQEDVVQKLNVYHLINRAFELSPNGPVYSYKGQSEPLALALEVLIENTKRDI